MIGILLALAAHAAPPTDLKVEAPPYNDGLNLELSWSPPADEPVGYAVLRADAEAGPYTVVVADLPGSKTSFADKVTTDARKSPPKAEYFYKVVALSELPEQASDADSVLRAGQASAVARGVPEAALLTTSPGHLVLMAMIATVGGLMFWFAKQAREGKPIFIRRIPGIDAIEEGIGRATEMGRPVLYVPGIDELQDIQTIASMLILGQVSKMVAEYQSDIVVSCCIPMVREVADEVVKAGFFQGGHPDAYNPADIRFISSEQFAFTAGTNGIILREQPATNIYLGRFFAESLILAETGYVNRSIQIAGTAEATQLPFFVAACDYTLIGEELFAVSAYLSKDPRLVSSLKASDYVKIFVVVMLVLGTIGASLGFDGIITLFTIGEGG